jgi:hypothetical protein
MNEPGNTDENEGTSPGASQLANYCLLEELWQVASVIGGGGLVDLDDGMSVDGDNDNKDKDDGKHGDDNEDGDNDKDDDDEDGDGDEDSEDEDNSEDGSDSDDDDDLGPADGEDQGYLDTGYSAF